MWRIHIRSVVFCVALIMLVLSTAIAQVQLPVSGYEIFLGHDCNLSGTLGTCGTTFTGWTGGGTTWVPFPGTGLGAWSIQINYIGKAMFGGSVNVVGGKWSLLLLNGTQLRGKVLSGSVTWPEDENTDIGCGMGVAVAEANLKVTGGGTGTINGCLHDLPAGSVIPPKVWGAFSF